MGHSGDHRPVKLEIDDHFAAAQAADRRRRGMGIGQAFGSFDIPGKLKDPRIIEIVDHGR